jgi:hypothetical protein
MGGGCSVSKDVQVAPEGITGVASMNSFSFAYDDSGEEGGQRIKICTNYPGVHKKLKFAM